ncbi:MAG: phosphoenolpyruvate carboxykinase (GTP) [Candidatus Aenigmarchaeota archaeon]|nr:phosphoenolpyruvate carboxykinase (GTP) [Candidatus Aenigmarchaeota archaeon]
MKCNLEAVEYIEKLKQTGKLTSRSLQKLILLGDARVNEKIVNAISLCKPEKVTVLTDSPKDAEYIRKLSLRNKEEHRLAISGHTVHFDGYFDQARDKNNTRYLLPEGMKRSSHLNATDRESGLKEIFGLFDGSMKGKEMLVMFFWLGPCGSEFSIPAMQITDSAYVAHSETILFRPGYEFFRKTRPEKFFFFLHSAGKLEDGKTAEIDKRRIYIDLHGDSVYTVNNQYAGNSVGLKKLGFRLAIKKAVEECWLAEHMFVMAVHGPNKRKTYFTGAFPSACGKTSTAMLPGQTIIGDDIAYIRKGKDGTAYAVNAEQGIFGIIQDVNKKDDPITHMALTTPKELIFSNVLVKDRKPYWIGMGEDIPESGTNFIGKWHMGMKGPDGKPVPFAHPNARYTLRIRELENADTEIENPDGVPVKGFIFGVRDPSTSVPVVQSLSWNHGVLLASSMESETTSATIGGGGNIDYNPMANLDFLPVSVGTYVDHYIKFGKELKNRPVIFSVNYFLKENGQYLNGMLDKKVWLLWMEGRVNGDFDAIETPIGFIPKYEDLSVLFKEHLGKDYTRDDYEKQFAIRVDMLLQKFSRIEKIFSNECVCPEFIHELVSQKARLQEAEKLYGTVMHSKQ